MSEDNSLVSRPKLKRSNALKMSYEENKIKNTSIFALVFWRLSFNLHFYNKILFYLIFIIPIEILHFNNFQTCFRSNLKVEKSIIEIDTKDLDEFIEFKKQHSLKLSMLKSNSQKKLDIESGDANLYDVEDIDTLDISNSEFTRICKASSKTSLGYSKLFFYFDLICKVADVVSLLALPAFMDLGFSDNSYIIIICVVAPIIFLQYTCDFPKFNDKYARLYSNFNKLSTATDNERVDRYSNFVKDFRNCWFYSDFISYTEIDYNSN